MLIPTWKLDDEARRALAEHRIEFLYCHIAEQGGSPRRTKSPTSILVPLRGRIFSVWIRSDEPRLVTVALASEGPAVPAQKAITAAQLAGQHTIVGKIQLEPHSEKLVFVAKAEFFIDDEDDLTRVFGLYLAALHDTYERFLDELIDSA